jgi:hypothetical protein
MRNVSQPVLKLLIQNHSQPMDINQGIHHLMLKMENPTMTTCSFKL